MEKRCILCGKENTKISRGLCPRHYSKINRQLKYLDPDERDQVEAELIAKGELLPIESRRKLGGFKANTSSRILEYIHPMQGHFQTATSGKAELAALLLVLMQNMELSKEDLFPEPSIDDLQRDLAEVKKSLAKIEMTISQN